MIFKDMVLNFKSLTIFIVLNHVLMNNNLFNLKYIFKYFLASELHIRCNCNLTKFILLKFDNSKVKISRLNVPTVST